MSSCDTRPLALYIHSVNSGFGAEQVVLNLAAGLAGHGHAVDLLLEEPYSGAREGLPVHVNVVELENGRATAILDLLLRCASLIVNALRPGRPDPIGEVKFRTALSRFLFKRRPPLFALVRYLLTRRPESIMSFLNYPNVALMLAAQLSRGDARVYVNVRNHISNSVAGAKSRRMREMPVLMRNLFSLADRVVAVSDGVACDIARLTDTPASRMTTLFNPVYRPELLELAAAPPPHPWLRSDAPPVILGAGKMKAQKDFSTLLNAFARVRQARPVRLIILGDGAYRERLEAEAQNLGIQVDIDFPGYVDNPYAYYRYASVFVLSSAWEGLPNVLIEAMACGCAVVSTDCPSGPAEILDDGRLGRLVPVGDDETMAAAITKTLDENPTSEPFVERARHFSFDRIVARYDRLLARQVPADH